MGRFCGIDPSLIDQVLSEAKEKDSKGVVKDTGNKGEADEKNRQESLYIDSSDRDLNNQGG